MAFDFALKHNLTETLAQIKPTSEVVAIAARERWNSLAKPLYSMPDCRGTGNRCGEAGQARFGDYVRGQWCCGRRGKSSWSGGDLHRYGKFCAARHQRGYYVCQSWG